MGNWESERGELHCQDGVRVSVILALLSVAVVLANAGRETDLLAASIHTAADPLCPFPHIMMCFGGRLLTVIRNHDSRLGDASQETDCIFLYTLD